MKALVLAAGRSTRIRPLAGDLPKPLLPVRGRPILDHTLAWLAESGVAQVWINLHYQGDRIRQHVRTGEQFGLTVRYSEEDPILGTAGAVRKLRAEWDDTFLVVYGDNLLRFTLAGLLDAHRSARPLATLALFDPRRQAHTGVAGGRVALGPGNDIERFIEGGAAAGDTSLVNAGVYALEPGIVDWIAGEGAQDFGRDVFPRLLAAGVRVRGHLIDGYCLGLDAPELFARGLDLIERGEVWLG